MSAPPPEPSSPGAAEAQRQQEEMQREEERMNEERRARKRQEKWAKKCASRKKDSDDRDRTRREIDADSALQQQNQARLDDIASTQSVWLPFVDLWLREQQRARQEYNLSNEFLAIGIRNAWLNKSSPDEPNVGLGHGNCGPPPPAAPNTELTYTGPTYIGQPPAGPPLAQPPDGYPPQHMQPFQVPEQPLAPLPVMNSAPQQAMMSNGVPGPINFMPPGAFNHPLGPWNIQNVQQPTPPSSRNSASSRNSNSPTPQAPWFGQFYVNNPHPSSSAAPNAQAGLSYGQFNFNDALPTPPVAPIAQAGTSYGQFDFNVSLPPPSTAPTGQAGTAFGQQDQPTAASHVNNGPPQTIGTDLEVTEDLYGADDISLGALENSTSESTMLSQVNMEQVSLPHQGSQPQTVEETDPQENWEALLRPVQEFNASHHDASSSAHDSLMSATIDGNLPSHTPFLLSAEPGEPPQGQFTQTRGPFRLTASGRDSYLPMMPAGEGHDDMAATAERIMDGLTSA